MDYHATAQIPVNKVLLAFLVILTFGLILLFRPKRCVCCGEMKFI